MPDLRKILFGARDKNYVDVTALSAPSQRKAPSALKRKKKVFKIRIKKRKTKKITIAKPRAVRKILSEKKPKALGFFATIMRSSAKSARPYPKPVESPRAIVKPQKQAIVPKPKVCAEPLAGKVIHFLDKIQVAIVKVRRPLKVGDQVRFKGAKTDLTQTIDSMQINHQQVLAAKKGDEIGMKVKLPVCKDDAVFFQNRL